MKAVKRAILKYKDGRQDELFLFRLEETVFHWIVGNPAKRKFDGIDYLSKYVAIKALRVAVETEVALAGSSLTFYGIEPPPEERAATQIAGIAFDGRCYEHKDVEELSNIIRQETNITEILDATQGLLAYCFTRREKFAMALFPIQDGRKPRDMVFDGLLLSAIEAIGKATKQDFESLVKILKEPVSDLVIATNMPKGGKVQ